MSKFEKLTERAIDNIESDRQATENLLKDLQAQLTNGNYTHVEVGTIAAKFLETLQRSNEQLVKLVGIMSRQKESSSIVKLDDKEKESLFDAIAKGDVADG